MSQDVVSEEFQSNNKHDDHQILTQKEHKPTIISDFIAASYRSYVTGPKTPAPSLPSVADERGNPSSSLEKLSDLLQQKSSAAKSEHESLVERIETLLEKVSVSSLSGVDDHKSLSTSLNHSFFEFRHIRDMFNSNEMDATMSIVSEEDVAILASHCLYMLEYYNTISSEFRDQKKLLLVLRVINNYSEQSPTTNTLRREQTKRRLKFMNHLLSESERFQQLLCKFIMFSNIDHNDKVQYLCAKCLSNFMKNQLRHKEPTSQKKLFVLNVDTLRVIGMCLETLCDKLLVRNAETFVHVHFYQLLINILYDHYIELDTNNGDQRCLNDNHEHSKHDQDSVDLYIHTQVKKLLCCNNQNSTLVKCLSLIHKYAEKTFSNHQSDVSFVLDSRDISLLIKVSTNCIICTIFHVLIHV